MNRDLRKGQMVMCVTENNKAAGVEGRKRLFFQMRFSNREGNKQEHESREEKSPMYIRGKIFAEQG